MQQRGSNYAEFSDMDTGDFRKSVEELQIWLKSDKNYIGHFAWRPEQYFNVAGDINSP
jgi:hypothetical protein